MKKRILLTLLNAMSSVLPACKVPAPLELQLAQPATYEQVCSYDINICRRHELPCTAEESNKSIGTIAGWQLAHNAALFAAWVCIHTESNRKGYLRIGECK